MPIKETIRKVTTSNPEKLKKKMIAEAAYYLAEQREFKGEHQIHDWLEAEKKIHRTYGKYISKR